MGTFKQLTSNLRQPKVKRQKTPALLEATKEFLLSFNKYQKKRKSSPQKKRRLF